MRVWAWALVPLIGCATTRSDTLGEFRTTAPLIAKTPDDFPHAGLAVDIDPPRDAPPLLAEDLNRGELCLMLRDPTGSAIVVWDVLSANDDFRIEDVSIQFERVIDREAGEESGEVQMRVEGRFDVDRILVAPEWAAAVGDPSRGDAAIRNKEVRKRFQRGLRLLMDETLPSRENRPGDVFTWVAVLDADLRPVPGETEWLRRFTAVDLSQMRVDVVRDRWALILRRRHGVDSRDTYLVAPMSMIVIASQLERRSGKLAWLSLWHGSVHPRPDMSGWDLQRASVRLHYKETETYRTATFADVLDTTLDTTGKVLATAGVVALYAGYIALEVCASAPSACR